MRIALCLSGQPRSVEKGFEYYKKNLFDVVEHVDVFYHTWSQSGRDLAWPVYKDYVAFCDCEPPLGNEAPINSRYTNTPDATKWPPYFTVSAYYSILQSMIFKTTRENQYGQYDWVIKSRFDFALSEPIPFDRLVKNTIYMPPCRRVFGDWLGNDQFAVGDSEIMNKYMSTYLYMNQFYNNGTQMIGEEMLRANLLYHNVAGRIGYIDMKPPFPPGPRNGTPHFLIRDDIGKWSKQ